jgi:hypothetical protein
MPSPVAPRQYRRKAAHWLVSVDLGKVKVGVARWWVTPDDAQLAWADTLICSRPEPSNVANAVVLAAMRDVALVTDIVWVCEWPKKYPTMRSTHKNIDELHAVGEALAYHDRVGPWTRKFSPHEWKGNVPKAAHHDRLREALGPLDIPASEHDTWDAVGIGAFALGLTRRGAVR